MSLTRVILSVILTYWNHLISRTPLIPSLKTSTSMDSKKDSIFVTVSSFGVLLSQIFLIFSTSCELLLALSAYINDPWSSQVAYFLCEEPAHAVSKIRLPPSSLAAWGVGLFGCVLRFAAMNTLGGFFTFQLVIREKHELITTGPYAYVRHPGYSGSIVAALGTGAYFLGAGSYTYEFAIWTKSIGMVLAMSWISWKTFMVFNVTRRCRTEDGFLRDKFGASWNGWAAKVQYRLLPGVY